MSEKTAERGKWHIQAVDVFDNPVSDDDPELYGYIVHDGNESQLSQYEFFIADLDNAHILRDLLNDYGVTETLDKIESEG